MIRVFNPVGEIAAAPETGVNRAATLHGARAGLVFNHHPATVSLWAELERTLSDALAPSAVHRVAKANISVPQPQAELATLAADIDYALVGVGA